MSESGVTDAYEVGRRYESSLDASARRLGAHFTPPDVAEMLVDRALAAWQGGGAPVICDPSCGGGVFLIAAAEALRRRGHDPASVVDELIVGIDLDAGAVAASIEALRVWARDYGAPSVEPRVRSGDALASPSLVAPGSVDVVVGNPPFQNQLGGATARTADERRSLTARFGDASTGYVDIAALFVLAGLELVGDRGVVALIQPRSFLVARDVAGVRERVLASADIVEAWVPGERVFAAMVDVCATVLRRSGIDTTASAAVLGGRLGSVSHGSVSRTELAGAPTWSPMWAVAHGIPEIGAQIGAELGAAARPATIGSVATATAGFRDQYYGLLPHLCHDRPADGGRVATTGMIDPGRCAWEDRPVRIAKQRWTAPWLDRAGLRAADDRLGAWVDRLAVPKVLLATQTRVIEAAADLGGDIVPFTPVIAILPIGEPSVAHIEAALLAPAATAWAFRRFGGAGMSPGSLKLAARQVLQIPLPVHGAAWDAAVELIAAGADWSEIGRTLNEAWRIDDDALLEWWLGRLRSSIH